MTQKYQRPSGSYSGQTGLNNRSKYIEDANASPKRAISSSKMDGDFNYLIDAVNNLDDASGNRASIAERLDVSLNADGTLKVSVAGALDEWVIHQNPGTLARLDNSSFSVAGGDFTALYQVNRRVRIMVSGVPLVGDVASVAFAAGTTTISLVDIVDGAGALAVINTTPTQVAYGPLTPGVKGNMPRRTDGLNFVMGNNTFAFGNDAGDLLIQRNGVNLVRMSASGLFGLAPGSVGYANLVGNISAALAPAGMVAPFAGASAPTGWLMCGGQAVSRTTNAGLFTAIGTTYGVGDGSTTFNLPDLRGRSVFGLDNMGGTAANRVTSAISVINGTTLGAVGGSQALHTHTHGVTDPGHAHALPASLALAAGAGTAANATSVSLTPLSNTASTPTGITLANAGSGNSQNMPPAMMLNYIIKV